VGNELRFCCIMTHCLPRVMQYNTCLGAKSTWSGLASDKHKGVLWRNCGFW
jgi:hypothetical protein